MGDSRRDRRAPRGGIPKAELRNRLREPAAPSTARPEPSLRNPESTPRYRAPSRHRGKSRDGLGGLHRALGSAIAYIGAAAREAARSLRTLDAKKALPIAIASISGLGLVAALALVLIRGPAFPMPEGELLPDDGAAADLILSYALPDASGDEDDELFSKVPPPPATLEIQSYTVRSGDSLNSIAKRFRLAPDSIISINGIKSAKAMKTGTSLKIPNMDGLVYRVRSGDNLAFIAKAYRTDTTRLADANDLGSSVLIPGQTVFIPGAKLPAQELRRIFGERVAWPIRGQISSYFGYRPNPFTGIRQFHAGLDIVAAQGTPIRAAIDGKVADAGYNTVFGNYVIINHADGLQTLYGHMTAYAVKVGQKLSQGAVIGRVGSTGYSTGPHLHFGLFKGGSAVNPLKYLK